MKNIAIDIHSIVHTYCAFILQEPREALCECRDSRIVCGSNGQTYLSECRLREAAHSRQGLVVSSWSPCVAG